MEERREYKFEPKPLFKERMDALLENEEDRKAFWKIVHTLPRNTIRVNTLKISPAELRKRLEEKGWKISQLYKEYEEIMIVENNLLPGELGRSREHLLGYFYIQEISSMLPILALKLTHEDSFLDLCASPGSKTTQAAAAMKNKGSIIANDNSFKRRIILCGNLEKCAVTNTIVTGNDGVQLCKKLEKTGMEFSKILVDVPCSGEGTIRSSPKTFMMWNLKMIEKLSRQQKILSASALKILKIGGEMIYSTCTHAPEENEVVVQFLLDNFDVKIEKIDLPLKTRQGINEWQGQKFDESIKNCVRLYPHDNDTEGFFLAKIKKLSAKIKNNEK